MRLPEGGYSESPPSTTRVCPVMKPARREQRKATAAAMSSVLPSRRSGVASTIAFIMSSVSELPVSSVRT